MKTFKVIYKNGHFIDTETQQRIIPIQDKSFVIVAEDASFASEDAKFKMPNVLSTIDKENQVKAKYGEENCLKIADVGDKFCFKVRNTKTTVEGEGTQYVFCCELLEDLYLYLSKGKSGKDAQDWRLVDCQCKLIDCLSGNLSLTAQVPAKSLNQLFNQTVMFYFSMQRSGSINVYDNFFVYEEGVHTDLITDAYIWDKNINQIRTLVALKRNALELKAKLKNR